MHQFYEILTGPALWFSFAVFLSGSIFQIARMHYLIFKKERFIFSFLSVRYGFRSILKWLTPFGTTSMRLNPIMTIVTFAFHLCIFILPVFLMAHIVLWDEAFDQAWFAIPSFIADFMTLFVICACGYFAFRRIKKPEVAYVTTVGDFMTLLLVVFPFVSGFWAVHQWPGYIVMHVLHILSGEFLLIYLPFSRLTHMLFAPFTRFYMGSEFGGIRHAQDW